MYVSPFWDSFNCILLTYCICICIYIYICICIRNTHAYIFVRGFCFA